MRFSETFEMTDLGGMKYFLGMEVCQSEGKIVICHKKYIRDVLKKFKMDQCKAVSTPICPKEKLVKKEENDEVDRKNFRSMIGCLMYITATRPDVLYSVSLLSRFLSDPGKQHVIAVKRILRYLKGTSDYGLLYEKSSKSCFSWTSKKQELVALSTAEAELVAVTAAAKQVIWVRKLLTDLQVQLEGATVVNIDN
ncbi:hypothetical protein K2173_022002 [Erythroxylum novogranatense]|uniref:Reverse transcriptase Ty1/copia-type domain-containing protein n=1 Tax=Erythroxylum novogranatense TaxID=1862640 RepID=A0AAV8T4A2_9ROSI|nr:hypothetical protein K2173_022002 [Erythroxylum novogranatense]